MKRMTHMAKMAAFVYEIQPIIFSCMEGGLGINGELNNNIIIIW